MNVTVLTVDSATRLPREAEGAVGVTGSHGAIYAAYLAAKAGVRARIGDGRSTLQDGTISAVNRPAALLGARVGKPALALARRVAEKAC